MADILIRGMEMPDGCYNCGFSYFDKGETNGGELCIVLMCSIINQGTNGADYNGNRPSWCPLVPLQEGHGRLIDADALDRAFTDLRFNSDGTLNHWGDRPGWCMHGYEVEKLIADAPTIVPAEGGVEE